MAIPYRPKKYCLLKDGTIEPCYYDQACKDPRRIEKENGKWYLLHDIVRKNYRGPSAELVALCKDEIFAFADSTEDLVFLKKKYLEDKRK